MHDSHSVCLLFFEILPKERSIRSLLYYLNKEAQLLMHFVHGQRITPMIQTLGPFIPGINWESQYLGQVTIHITGKPFKASFICRNVARGIRV